MVTYPQEWMEKLFNDFMKIKRGASPRPIERYLTKSTDGVNWIKIGDAPRFGKNITSTAEKITPHGAVQSVSVYPGDFILSNSMSFGRPYILNIDGCIHDGWLRLYDFQAEANDEFLYYLLSSSYVKKQYEAFAAGSGVQNLNKEVVKKVTVHLPSLPEQEEIARTLSQFDTYIDDLTELIEKKRGIRAVNDLVSGKDRLEGFTDEWQESTLSEIGTFLKGASLSKADIANTGTPFILYGELYTTYNEVTYKVFRHTRKTVDEKYYSRVGDVIIPTSGETAEEIATSTCVMIPGVILAGDLNIYRTTKMDGRFLSFVINHVINQKISEKAQGISIVHIHAKEIGKLTVKYPSIPEQTAIADILQAMDEEIEALEIERDKIIQIREGAMDDLLTGRVRLRV